jgi:hypothetical protein
MSGNSRPWYKRWWAIVLWLAVVVGATGAVTLRALGMTTVAVDAEPFGLPEKGFDYSWWDAALADFVRDGRVDYDAVLDQEAGLRSFVATLAVSGPTTTPERFRTEPEKLAYYVNAYNALTLLGVIAHWPIETVHDVHGWIDPREGFGFFYGLRFPLDGGTINLYDLENGVIRPFLDARIHAAINCASNSCPALAPYAFEPATLDEQFDAVTREFCSNAPHVVIDEEAEKVRLSAIFDWYRADFEEHARRLGRPATLEGFISAFASREVAAALSVAQKAGFEVVFEPYDWSLNQL